MESLPDESANLTPCFEEFLPHINASITTPVSTPSGTEVDSDEDDDVSNAEDEEMSDNDSSSVSTASIFDFPAEDEVLEVMDQLSGE
uniref:Uncharacterized protein n=1 Tax=Leersia perrieri TaxID=77586 RepID=A0A0D9VXV2_9ORYZ